MANNNALEVLKLLTTLRYTPSPNKNVRGRHAIDLEGSIPLLSRHVDRLVNASQALVDLHKQLEGQLDIDVDRMRNGDGYGSLDQNTREWHVVNAEGILAELIESLSDKDDGDWRVRILVSHDATIEVQTFPMPMNSIPFNPDLPSALPSLPSSNAVSSRKPKSKIILDPKPTTLSLPASHNALMPEMSEHERVSGLDDFCLRYKTTSRGIYEEAALRGKSIRTDVFDTLMHQRSTPTSGQTVSNETHDPEDDLITELTFSNIAFEIPISPKSSEPLEWVTPLFDPLQPFLRGVMRQDLLDTGKLRERRISVGDVRRWARERRRMVGMNGLRGVWEAELVEKD